MAEYLPIRTPGDALVSTASASITGGTLVAVSGNGTVATAGANAQNWIGVAAFDAVSGDSVTVYASGVQELTASGAITAGDLVVAAASGKVSSLAAVTTPTAGDVNGSRAIVGVALTTAADTAKVRVKFER
jgi:phosphotransferase system HPr-like phosphotransfer protein